MPNCNAHRDARSRTEAVCLLSALAMGLGSLAPGCGDDGGRTRPDASDSDDGGQPDAGVRPDGAVPPPPPEECTSVTDPVDISNPDAVVGTGTQGSCTEAALDAALSGGGIIVFDCGPDPFTLTVTSEKQIAEDTVIDGEGLITLSGGGTTRILSVPSSFERGWPLLTVQNLVFEQGVSSGGGDDTDVGGGAIWTRGGSLTIINCTFSDNRAPATGQDVAGGAVYNVGSGEVIIAGSVFSFNSASNGGALGVLHAQLAVVNTIFSDNQATGSGGNPGNGGNGGAIYIDGIDQNMYLCGVTIRDNEGGAFGGGLFRVSNNQVGDMVIDRTGVLGNVIADHDPSKAGGMYLQGVQIQLTNSTFAYNEARSEGGLFVGPGSTLNMTNVTVAHNTALSSLAGGLGISDGVTGNIINCTFARNRAPGDVAFAAATLGGGSVVLKNTIVDGHEVGNGWNPISCRDTFLEGGGNLQWPVERAGGGSDDPDALCSPDILVQDSVLGDLQDNGGPTLTVMPGAASPALGRGTGCPPTDQRGEARSEPCTSGAVEAP